MILEAWMKSNPFKTLGSDFDAAKLAEQICQEDTGLPEHLHDAEKDILLCLTLYLLNQAPTDERNLYTITELLHAGITGMHVSDLDRLMDMLKEKHDEHICIELYDRTKGAVGSGLKRVLHSLLKRLSVFDMRSISVREHIERLGGANDGGILALGFLLSEHLGNGSEYYGADDTHCFCKLSMREAECFYIAALLAYCYHGRLDTALWESAFYNSYDPLGELNALLGSFDRRVLLLEERFPEHPAVEYNRQYMEKAGGLEQGIQLAVRFKLSFWNEFA